MKTALTLLLFLFLAPLASAQQEGGPTYSGIVVTATDTNDDGKADTFEVDLDSDGIADQTVSAGTKDGTEAVKEGMPVRYKLKKLQSRDRDKPRKLSEWVEIGDNTPPPALAKECGTIS